MRPVSNVNIPVHTFGALVNKVNELAYLFSTVAVTTFANTTGALTSGNAFVNGIFSANSLVAVEGLRGGSVSASGNLNVTSNANFRGISIFAANITQTFANTGLLTGLTNGDVVIDTASVRINSANTFLTGATFNVTANTNINNANTVVQGGRLAVSSNVSLTGANVSIGGTNTTISSNVNLTGAKTTISGANVDFTTVTFGGALINVEANVNITAANLNVTSTNAVIAGANLAVSSNVNLTGARTSISGANLVFTTVTVTGVGVTFAVNTSFTGALTTIGGANLNTTANATFAKVNVTGLFTTAANVTIGAGTHSVGGDMTFANNVVFNALATFNANVAVTQITANTIVIPTGEVRTFSNANLGTNVSSNVIIGTLSGTTYKTGRVSLQFVALSGETQYSEMHYAANSTSVAFSLAGTTYSGGSQLANNISAIYNAGTVEIYARQANANTAVKAVCHVIR